MVSIPTAQLDLARDRAVYCFAMTNRDQIDMFCSSCQRLANLGNSRVCASCEEQHILELEVGNSPTSIEHNISELDALAAHCEATR